MSPIQSCSPSTCQRDFSPGLAPFSGGRTLIEVSPRQQPERAPGGEVRQVVLRTTSILAHWLQLSLRPIPEPICHMTGELAFADWFRAVSLMYAWGWGQPAQTRSNEAGGLFFPGQIRVTLPEKGRDQCQASPNHRHALHPFTTLSERRSCHSLSKAPYFTVSCPLPTAPACPGSFHRGM